MTEPAKDEPFFYRISEKEDVETLVLKYHYSHRMPANVQFCASVHRAGGLFGDFGEPIAGVLFSIPPTRWAEDVWELSRLVRADDVSFPLTKLISFALSKLRRKADLIVSFADWTQGHHGGIYQACSWNYNGCRESRMDGVLIDGVFVPGRSCNSAWGTRSPVKLRSRLKSLEVEGHYDQGKHLYWKALNKNGTNKAGRLRLTALPYPKPGAGMLAASACGTNPAEATLT